VNELLLVHRSQTDLGFTECSEKDSPDSIFSSRTLRSMQTGQNSSFEESCMPQIEQICGLLSPLTAPLGSLDGAQPSVFMVLTSFNFDHAIFR
jgi:hypothetical protein